MPDFKRDRQRAIEWAQSRLSREDVVILDSETTDFQGEIVELAIIDTAGNVLYDQRISPLLPIHPKATEVHGHTAESLADQPQFWSEYDRIRLVLEKRLVLIYNAAFDVRALDKSCEVHCMPPLSAVFHAECAMTWYAQFYGEWSRYHRSYTWQRLPGGDHSALGDARATIDLLLHMANGGE